MQIEKRNVENAEISLKEIVSILKQKKWWIVCFGLLGLILSIMYILMAPKVYEAKWQMQMAQLITSNSNSNSSSFSNSEEPLNLIQRLRFTTSYPVEVLHSCGVPEGGSTEEFMGGALEAQAVKNLPTIVEVKISANSIEQARECSEALVAMIVVQQQELIRERLVGRQEQLLQYQQAFKDETQQLEKVKKAELSNSGYLAKLDKLSWLRTRIDVLQEEAMLSKKHPARLTSPIFIPSKPVSPKKRQVLLSGVLLGLMLGAMYFLGRALLRKAT